MLGVSYQDLGEHVGTLVSLLTLFAGVSALLLWRMLVRLEKKLEELSRNWCECREELGERFVGRFEHEVHRQDLWQAVNHHAHDLGGRVVR
jgi:hypothetical protein